MDLPIPETWAEAAKHVLPVLRGPTSPPNAWLAALDNAEAVLVRRPVSPFLHVCVVLDLPRVRLYVNQGHLDRWKVDADEVVRVALDNLPPATGLQPWELDGAWTLDSGDGYAASRLALPGWLAAFEDKVRGQPFAVVPDVDTILVTGTGSGLVAEAVLKQAWERFHAAGTPISPIPITVGAGGRPVPWTPPLDHALVHWVHTCQRFGAGHEYRRQQDALEQWLVDHEIADYLATYNILRRKGGRVTSFAYWPDGPTLLPQVDLVVLGPPGSLDESSVVPWSELVDNRIIDEPEPGVHPPRYRVRKHPILRSLPSVDPREYQPD